MTIKPIIHTSGARKRAIARVFLKKKDEKEISIKIKVSSNKHIDYKDYFVDSFSQSMVFRPLTLLEDLINSFGFEIIIDLRGGGKSGQAGAASHALAKALNEFNAAEYRGILKSNGLLKRDARIVERKKYGQPKARKKNQFSKR